MNCDYNTPFLSLFHTDRPKEWEQYKVYKMQVPNFTNKLPFSKAFSNRSARKSNRQFKIILFVGKWRIFMHRPCLAGATRPYSNGPSRPFPPTLVALPVALGELKSDDRTKKHDSKSEAKKTRELFSKLLLRYSIHFYHALSLGQ